MTTAKLHGLLVLMRPPNLPTAAADILAGLALAGVLATSALPVGYLSASVILVFSSIFLYAGGVVLNDVYDLEIDRVERPERPIPSGVVTKKEALAWGYFHMGLGALLPFFVNPACGLVAVLLAMAILLYDTKSKKSPLWGPLNMGLCRALNLLLGIVALGSFLHWQFALLPLVYIAAITLISRGEVYGDNKGHIVLSALLYTGVIMGLLGLQLLFGMQWDRAIPFAGLLAIAIFVPLVKAYKENSPHRIRGAVKAGVLAIILLDAAMAAGMAPWWYIGGILLLWPLSVILAKLFAVT